MKTIKECNDQKWFKDKLKEFENDPEFIREYKECGEVKKLITINWLAIGIILFCIAEILVPLYFLIKYLT